MCQPSTSPRVCIYKWCSTLTATERWWWWEKRGLGFANAFFWLDLFWTVSRYINCGCLHVFLDEFSLECSTAVVIHSSGIAWEKRPLSIVQVFFHGGVLFCNGSTLTFRCFGTGLNCSKWIRVDSFFKSVNALLANTTIQVPALAVGICEGAGLTNVGFSVSYVHVYLSHCMVR